jgi:tripartite-type tricarboxylate transporter receptor subunit TctC
MLRKLFVAVGCATLATFAWTAAKAEYPERTINVIVPYNPGGGTDITARTIIPFVEKYLEGKMIIVNKPGGAGEIGTTEVALAKPSGYIIGTFNVPNTLIKPAVRKTRYTLDSFEPIANLVYDRSILAVKADSPFKTAKDLFDYAKAHPQEIKFGSSGVASNNHLEILMYQDQVGVEFTIVHAEGGALNRNNILGGHVDVTATSITDLTQFIIDGQIRALCIHGAERMDKFPDIQTCKEQGYDWNEGSARGLIAPKGTPADIVKKLEAAVQKALADPECQKKADAASLPLRYMPSSDYSAFLQRSWTTYSGLWKKYSK